MLVGGESDGCKVCVLEISWNHSVIVLEILSGCVKSPKHEHSLVSNGAELDVAILDEGVYLNLVDGVVSHNR